jgi:hypothetical protein
MVKNLPTTLFSPKSIVLVFYELLPAEEAEAQPEMLVF